MTEQERKRVSEEMAQEIVDETEKIGESVLTLLREKDPPALAAACALIRVVFALAKTTPAIRPAVLALLENAIEKLNQERN